MLVILAFRKLRQEDHEFKDSLNYIASVKPAWPPKIQWLGPGFHLLQCAKKGRKEEGNNCILLVCLFTSS
jgi:hypothetical protein